MIGGIGGDRKSRIESILERSVRWINRVRWNMVPSWYQELLARRWEHGLPSLCWASEEL